MAYVRDHARFTILDDVPADVWQEQEHTPGDGLLGITSDPEKYLCITGEEPFDYYGSFTACTFTRALYQCVHIGVSAEYLASCELAPEETARKILAFYLRNWAHIEDDDTAALLLEDAERITRG